MDQIEGSVLKQFLTVKCIAVTSPTNQYRKPDIGTSWLGLSRKNVEPKIINMKIANNPVQNYSLVFPFP